MYGQYPKKAPKKLKTAQRKRNTEGSDRVEVIDEEQEPANTAVRPTDSTPELGGSTAVETTNPDSNEALLARLQRIETGYANIERMLLALSQQKPSL